MMRYTSLLAAGLAATPAHAVQLDDLLAAGYSVAAATKAAGSFTGCVRQHLLVFADGSVFACARTKAQTAYEPRITILQRAGGPPSVVLAGSVALPGELIRLRAHTYAVPLRMDADPLPERRSIAGAELQPVGSIASMNVLNSRDTLPLALQQAIRPSRPFRSSR